MAAGPDYRVDDCTGDLQRRELGLDVCIYIIKLPPVPAPHQSDSYRFLVTEKPEDQVDKDLFVLLVIGITEKSLILNVSFYCAVFEPYYLFDIIQ